MQNISTNSHFLPHKGKETTLTTMQFSASLLHIQSVIGEDSNKVVSNECEPCPAIKAHSHQ